MTVHIEPVRRSRVSQQVALEICRLIQCEQMAAGDRLPPERELAERLQVSRTSLREALRILEISGVVESRHGGGTFVRDFSEFGLISPLALGLAATGDTIGDLWEVRMIFEPSIAARAASRASEHDLACLAENLEKQAALFGQASSETALALDREFHTLLARASGNEVAVRVLQLVNQLLHESRGHFITAPARRVRAYEGHRQILEAVKTGDPRAARDAMLRHLREVEDSILGDLEENAAAR